MARKLRLVSKGPSPKASLVYGMRIIEAGTVREVEDGEIKLAGGGVARVTLHTIDGTKAQIRRRLMESIDAFFELMEESPDTLGK